MMINGMAHGPRSATTACQLHMRSFNDGDHILIEPFRASAFPVIRDLVVDRSSLDRVIQAGGFVSVGTGAAPDGNAILVPKEMADRAMDAAQCIGCGACVAACPNASAMLFTSAKVSHLALLPQGQPERYRRVLGMVEQMDAEGFGGLHQLRRMRSGVSEGDLDREHRADEPRLLQGFVEGTRRDRGRRDVRLNLRGFVLGMVLLGGCALALPAQTRIRVTPMAHGIASVTQDVAISAPPRRGGGAAGAADGDARYRHTATGSVRRSPSTERDSPSRMAS